MPDTSNQIIQTLEAIHNDIKAAKSTLKENNVELISNSTSTLSTEINKIPTAIKESKELLGFNSGSMSLSGGFLFDPRSSYIDKVNATILETDDGTYTVPKNKDFRLSLSKLPNPTDSSKATMTSLGYYKYKLNADPSNISSVLNRLTKDYMFGTLKNLSGWSNSAPNIDVYIHDTNNAINIDTNNIATINNFSMPGYYGKLFINDKEITKVKTNEFTFSTNLNITDVECDKMIIKSDSMYHIFSKFTDMNMEGFQELTSEQSTRFNSQEPALRIKMNDVNFEFNALSEKTHFNSISRYFIDPVDIPSSLSSKNHDIIQIFVEENESNIAKLHTKDVMLNVLQFIKVSNLDGTKIYSYKENKFIPKNEFTNIAYNLEYDDWSPYVNYEHYVLNRVVCIPSVSENDTLKQETYAPVNVPSFCLSMVEENGYIRWTYDKDNMITFLKNAPDCYDFDLFSYRQNLIGMMLGNTVRQDKELKFNCPPNSDNKLLMPLLYFGCGKLSGASYGASILNKVIIDKCGYDDIDGKKTLVDNGYKHCGLLLASPYDTKFTNYSGEMLESAFLSDGVITYNENIKTVKFKENSTAYVSLIVCQEPYLRHTEMNPDGSGTFFKLTPPAEPAKFIFTNTTKVKSVNDILLTAGGQDVVLGPYSTNALAKIWDKFINVLVPEDYPGLGTYEFEHYRLPVYNLDKTKKYNYSKKAWEPITTLTDDSKQLSEIYPNYYDKIPSGLTGVTTAGSVIEYA